MLRPDDDVAKVRPRRNLQCQFVGPVIDFLSG
jgi:hypothetical protein